MKKKININRPEISSQEIAQRKNFDAVLKNNAMHAAPQSLLKKPWFLSGVVVATIAIVTTAVLLTQHPKTPAPVAVTDSTSAPDQKALDAFYKTGEAKPCIAPPIKGLNVNYTVFKVDAQKGGKLDFKTGSQLSIPKNAFTDAKGNPVKGEVELRYREFHDAADFFVSGIRMTYDSAGLKYQFESAGMMEMLAYQNGKPVNIAPGKSIDVAMASDNNDPKFNLYKLDTVKNNWSCLGKDKVVAKAEKPVTANVPAPVIAVDKTPEFQKIETQKTEAKTVKETQIAALPTPGPEPKKPEKAEKGKYTFNIDVDPKEYPELAVYKGLLFEVGPENKDFSSSMYTVTWDAATIKEGSKKGQNYRLTLEKGTRKYELLVYPVFEGKDYETALKDFQDTFGKYTVTLNKRIADEKKIEDIYLAKIEAYKKQQEALEREWKKKMDSQLAHMTTQEKVMRVFSLNSFGVYNSDCPGQYPKGVSCTASLTNEKKVPLMCYDVFLVDKKVNALFSYYKNPVAQFSYNPASENMLWTVENGVLYYMNPEQVATIKNGEQTLKMTRCEKEFKTVDEMKAFFNL